MPSLSDLTDELLLKQGLITLQGDWSYTPRRWCAVHDFGAFSYHDVPGEPEYIACINCGHVEPLNAVAYEPLQAVPDNLELAQHQWLTHRKQGRLKHVENPNKHPQEAVAHQARAVAHGLVLRSSDNLGRRTKE